MADTKKRVTITSGALSISIDASTDVSHEWNSDATDYPIEGGFSNTDHITVKSKKITVVGIVTLAKINPDDKSTTPRDFEGDMYQAIASRSLWSVDTKYRLYTDYTLETFSLKNKGDTLEVTMGFKEVRKTQALVAKREYLLASDALAAAGKEHLASLQATIATQKALQDNIDKGLYGIDPVSDPIGFLRRTSVLGYFKGDL